jgi:hypothetical protein
VQSGASIPNSPVNTNGTTAQSPTQNGTASLLRTANTTPVNNLKNNRGSVVESNRSVGASGL